MSGLYLILPATFFSLTTAMAQNVEIVSKNQHMTLKKGKFSIDFRPICKNKNGFMLGITVEREFEEKAFRVSTPFPPEPKIIQQSQPTNTPTTVRFIEDPQIIEATARAPKLIQPNQLTMDTNKYHKKLGHVCEDTTRFTAKFYGIKLSTKFLPCGDCALAKRTQHRLPREATNPATKCGGRMFLDVTEIRNLSLGGRKYLAALTDEFSSKKFPMFLKQKSELIPSTIKILEKIYVQYKTPVLKLRMDNAGENLHFQHELNKNLVLSYMGTTVDDMGTTVDNITVTRGRLQDPHYKAFTNQDPTGTWKNNPVVESPRNNFEAGRAPVQDTPTGRSVFLNDARIQLPTVKTLSLTTKVSPVGCNSLIRKNPKTFSYQQNNLFSDNLFESTTQELYSYDKIRSLLPWNISDVEHKHLVGVNPDFTTTENLKAIGTVLPPIKLIEKIIAGPNLRESNNTEPTSKKDLYGLIYRNPSKTENTLVAKFDTDSDNYFYDIDFLDDDIYENSEPTNRKGGPTLSYHDFIYYDIGDRYFDIDDGDLYNFDIIGNFTFKIISNVTITEKPTFSFYRINEIRNLSNLSKTEKI